MPKYKLGVSGLKHQYVNIGSGTGINGLHYAVENVVTAAGPVMYLLNISADSMWTAIGFKATNDYASFILFSYSTVYLCSREGGVWFDFTISKTNI